MMGGKGQSTHHFLMRAPQPFNGLTAAPIGPDLDEIARDRAAENVDRCSVHTRFQPRCRCVRFQHTCGHTPACVVAVCVCVCVLPQGAEQQLGPVRIT